MTFSFHFFKEHLCILIFKYLWYEYLIVFLLNLNVIALQFRIINNEHHHFLEYIPKWKVIIPFVVLHVNEWFLWCKRLQLLLFCSIYYTLKVQFRSKKHMKRMNYFKTIWQTIFLMKKLTIYCIWKIYKI